MTYSVRVNLSAIDLRLTVSSSCLAHIINLATQALISTRSKAEYYSPDDEDAHIPDLTTLDRDEAGLVRAICVKARTSAQRKALFKSIQVENNIKPLQLLLDMTVCWGSTFVMMTRAESRREVCQHSVIVRVKTNVFSAAGQPVCVPAQHEGTKCRKAT